MDAYKIVFVRPGEAVLKKFEVSDPKDSEVQVKIHRTLISAGTEKAVFSGSQNAAKSGFPRSEGYSAVGYVTKVGKGVKSYHEGDRVFVEYGGHAGFITKNTRNVYQIPDGVSFDEAVFTKVASFPLAAIRRARMEIGESVVIVGLGMLGLFGVQFARIGGAMPLIAVGGSRQDRMEKAKLYGADHVLSGSDPELTEKIFEITQNKTAIKGASVVVETSGSESGLLKCLEYTATRGRVMLNGCNRVMTQPVDFYTYVHRKGVSMIGVHGKSRMPHNSAPGNWTVRRDYTTVLGMLEDGRLDAKSMISEYADPHDAPAVYDRLLHDRDFPLGVLFDWEHFSA